MMTPIFIPQSYRAPEPDRCPKCDYVEDVKITCKHCHHVYSEKEFYGEGSSILLEIATIIFIIGVIGWALWTLCMWLMPYPEKEITLIHVLLNQWHWLKSLRVW